jgi:hypothetical protein
MADQNSSTPVASLPPPPHTQPAPGQQEYQPAMSAANGPSHPAHMPPPPLPPVVIPQNNNPIPTAVTSPFMAGSAGGLMSPASAGPRRAAPEPNKRALYVGGLDPRIGEEVLRQIFETAGHVQNVKIIPDKNVSEDCFCCCSVFVFVSMSACTSTKMDDTCVCRPMASFYTKIQMNVVTGHSQAAVVHHQSNGAPQSAQMLPGGLAF